MAVGSDLSEGSDACTGSASGAAVIGSAGVVVTAEARSGLLRDVLDMLAREQCPLLSVQSQTVKELSRFTLVLEVPSAEVLDKLRNAIRQIPGVMGCRRA